MRGVILESLISLVDLTDRKIIIKLTEEEETKIEEFLELEDYNKMELKIMRNAIVLALSHEIYSAYQINDIKKADLLNSWLTVTTSMIDKQIIKVEGE